MATPLEFAISLIDRLLADDLTVDRFCSLYEQHWNFNWPGRESMPSMEHFRSLFEVVAWYSPFPEERLSIPRYTSEEQVRAVARQVRAAVGA